MARKPRKGRGRSLPALRHHLEDHHDRELESGLDAGLREKRYAHRARRHFDLVLRGELTDPLFEDLELSACVPADDGTKLTLEFRPKRGATREELDELNERLESARGRLRASLARDLPRRRVPDLRIVLLAPDEGGEA